MNLKVRTLLFLLGALGVGAGYVKGVLALPPVGNYPGPYGDIMNHLAVSERKVTDIVTAVNFDLRGIDTLGEEFILFASVIGSLLLIREQEERKEATCLDQCQDRGSLSELSDAVKVWALGMTGPTVLYGIYMVTHGQLSPGGGFQGGVILATAPLLIYVAGNYEAFKKVANQHWVEAGEAFGALAFILIGFIPIVKNAKDAHFLENTLPLAPIGNVLSGGTIPLISLATGLEVAGGFVLLLSAFLQKALSSEDTTGRTES